ncbi:MAG: YihY/virulence factor BrkB family protein [Fimbriimonadaceae bacterium]|nr:YihY/virulence factor BrkB family protein [Fimbriimonadaceae bacterium]
METLRWLWRWLWEAGQGAGRHNLPRLAGAFSFFAALSIAPSLVIGVYVTARLFGQDDATRPLIDQIRQAVGSAPAEYVAEVIASSRRPENGLVATLLSLGIAFFGASNLFAALQDGVNTVFDYRPPGHVVQSWLWMRLRAFVSVAMYGGMALIWLLTDSLITYGAARLPSVWAGALSQVGLLIYLILILAIFFRTLVPVGVSWRDVWPSAILTAIGVWLCRNLAGRYFELIPVTRAYGSAGALIVLLLWIYYSAQVFFFGLELLRAWLALQRPNIDGDPMSESPEVGA